ncbi:MAG: hypothetical protein H6622_13660 [Halobacteriovoraceae bacterium]|nr:hypothetical protein [Halobacteriovoraceae bacterium]
MKTILLILWPFFLSSLALCESKKDAFDKQLEQPLPIIEKDYALKEEVTIEEHLVEDAQLRLRTMDYDTGILGRPYDVSNDIWKASIAYHVNSSLVELMILNGFELTVSRKTSNFWFEGFIQTLSAQFKAVAENPTPTGDSDSEGANPRADDDQETFLYGGIGMGYRFNLLTELFDSLKFFEHATVFMTYGMINDSLRELKYSGIGYRADYAMAYRWTKHFHIGTKMSYNILPSKRERLYDTESASGRSLTFSWVSFSAELGIYF